MKKSIIVALTICLVLTLAGCSFRTVDQMYCLPKRSQAYDQLQLQLDHAMQGRTYCAPLSGENQQTVQLADLDGDGEKEYLLFCLSADSLLQILIFDAVGEGYELRDTIEGHGYAFDRVEYVQMDDRPGLELIVGKQLSDQVLRVVSVYTFANGEAKQLLSTNYTRFLTSDLDGDDIGELLVLRPGQADTDNGIAELYAMKDGNMERYNEAPMSEPVDKLKRIIPGKLHGGQNAVFVASSVAESAIITDVYALLNGQLINVSLSNESGTSVQTLRNYYVYAEDIDSDGEVELPDLITMMPLDEGSTAQQQYLIRWYAMANNGAEKDKVYTYHNYLGGWYLQLEKSWADRISVRAEEGGYGFYLWDETFSQAQKIFSIYELTGQNREEQAMKDNRFVLHRSESILYCARLEVASGSINISQEDMVDSFALIHQQWNTGEM